jgi:hypothetical protein
MNRGGRDRCAGCHSDRREQLNAELTAQEPLRVLALRYGISKTSLIRHRAHLSSALVTVEVLPAARNGENGGMASIDDVATEARSLYMSCRMALDRAETGGNPLAVALAAREARASLDLLGRQIEKLELRQLGTPRFNPHTDREWIRVRTAMMQTLADYPEARRAVSNRLVALEGQGGLDA